MDRIFAPSVCIDAVLDGLSILDALNLVRNVGINAFEFWCWWEKDLDEIGAEASKRGMQVAACCTKFISLVDPATRTDYLEGLSQSIEAAQRLECKTLISQVGDFRVGISPKDQTDCLIEGLNEAARLLADTGITLVIEPLNTKVDHPGYFLVHAKDAFEIIDQVASPSIKVAYDVYHQQISEGNLIPTITENIDKIGHFHAAGHPGRNELGLGEINYPRVIEAIRNTEYSGYIGLEYWPLGSPETGLAEAAQMFES